jgi:phosphoesterase RecJ-like protein
MNLEITSKVKELLKTSRKIVVVGHKNPDGDAIGSCLGIANYLKQKGHQVSVIMPNDFPDFLKWIPEAETILIHEKKPIKTNRIIYESDLIFTLDFNALDRTGELQESLESTDSDFIMIDHHQDPDDYAIVTYSDVSICSTSQMVYHFIDALNDLVTINKNMATQLYVGIMTDTGSFRFPATNSTTHNVIAKLIDRGADNAFIHQSVYDTNTPQRIKLLGTALNNLTILSEFNTAFITLSRDELDLHEFKKGDTEGFVNYALSIKGINFGLIFIEGLQENFIKISLRSKGPFSVNDFAREHFNGGGHTNAAGGRSDKTLKETITYFISILPAYKESLSYES